MTDRISITRQNYIDQEREDSLEKQLRNHRGERLYILRDGNYYVQNEDRGKNGAPVWCYYGFYAKRMTHAEARDAFVKLTQSWPGIQIDPVMPEPVARGH